MKTLHRLLLQSQLWKSYKTKVKSPSLKKNLKRRSGIHSRRVKAIKSLKKEASDKLLNMDLSKNPARKRNLFVVGMKNLSSLPRKRNLYGDMKNLTRLTRKIVVQGMKRNLYGDMKNLTRLTRKIFVQ